MIDLSAAKAVALDRLIARRKRELAANPKRSSLATSVWSGGQVSRLTSDWVNIPLSADREQRYDIRRLRARARDLVRNTGFASRFLQVLEQNVIGHRGIILDAKIARGSGPHDTMNDLIEAEWKAWGHAESCTMDGRLDWIGAQRHGIRTVAGDGEVLVRLVRGASNPWGFGLQFIDADLLDTDWNRVAANGVNEIRMGVERDPWGRPVAYWVWKQHPQDYEFVIQENRRERIAADEIVHLALPRRVGETRSVTWLAPVLLNAKMLAGYFEAEVTAARIGAAKMGFITEASPELGIGAVPDAPPNDQPLTFDVEPGLIEELPPGKSFTPWNPDHPSVSFDAFSGACLREIASGLGISSVTLSNDLRQVNYSSIRTGMLGERDFYRELQHWMIEHFHRRVFGEWLQCAILTGRLPGSARVALDEGAICWQPRGWPWVDPLKDMEAEVLGIGNGLQSRTASLAEDGREIEDVFAELAAEKAAAEALGLIIEAAVTTPKSKPQDPEEADTTQGDDQPDGKSAPRAAVLRAMAARGDEPYTPAQFKALLKTLRAARPHANGNGNGRH